MAAKVRRCADRGDSFDDEAQTALGRSIPRHGSTGIVTFSPTQTSIAKGFDPRLSFLTFRRFAGPD